MAIYNREDPRTALPQLEKDLNARIDGLLDVFYPVGCYFETSDTDFDPNKKMGGIWVIDDAYTLVAWASVWNNALSASKNISSITNLGTASANIITFSKPMANTDYIVTASGEASGIASEILGVYGKSVNGFSFDHANYSGTATTLVYFTIGIFGRLATPESNKWHRIK